MKVMAIVPAYNEEQRLEDTLQAIKSIPSVDMIRVVNDGSSDRTAEVALQAGVELIDLKTNVGKGEALNIASKDVPADVVVFLDADLGKTAAEGEKIIRPIIDGEADLCIGKFPPPLKKGGFGFVKRLAAWGIRKEGLEVLEPLSGQRAMKVEVLKKVLPFHSGFGIEVGMTIRALRNGYRVKEVPVNMGHAETGRDLKGFIHRGEQFWDVLKVILRERR
ncbi:MAG: glycosyltransferase family 2 protein [Ignavibacteriales bacterium]